MWLHRQFTQTNSEPVGRGRDCSSMATGKHCSTHSLVSRHSTNIKAALQSDWGKQLIVRSILFQKCKLGGCRVVTKGVSGTVGGGVNQQTETGLKSGIVIAPRGEFYIKSTEYIWYLALFGQFCGTFKSVNRKTLYVKPKKKLSMDKLTTEMTKNSSLTHID